MFAGGGSAADSRTPAKPLWSEVMIFLGDFLRQGTPLPEETASSDKSIDHHKIDCAGEINSGERMFAGGEGVVRRPNSGEAAVVGGDDLFGCCPPAEYPLTGAGPSGKGIALIIPSYL